MATKKNATDFGGFVYLRKNDKFEVGGKYPFLKGFISISPDMLADLQDQEPDKFGNYKLEVAVWKGEDPEVLKGKTELPYVPQDKEAPKAKAPAGRKPARAVKEDDDF